MKHAAFAAPALAVVLAAILAGCATQAPPADDIRLTRRSETADDWSRHLPDLYRGLSACLAAATAQPAYALSVVPQNHGMMLVYVASHDGSRLACSIDVAAVGKPQLMPSTPLEDQALRGPRYTPAAMSEPFLRCGRNEPVLTRRGRLLGWLTYMQQDCSEVSLPRQQWRAFGDLPYWAITVARDGILFDRVGEVPLRYPARAGNPAGDTLTWNLDTQGGDSRSGDGRNRLELTLTHAPCRDSVAAQNYDYRAEAVFRGQTYKGCAVRGEQ
jgi:uncharacterized membrane protein